MAARGRAADQAGPGHPRESQDQLGERAEVSRVTVGSVERGEHPAAVTTYARLARAVDVPLADVLTGAP